MQQGIISLWILFGFGRRCDKNCESHLKMVDFSPRSDKGPSQKVTDIIGKGGRYR